MRDACSPYKKSKKMTEEKRASIENRTVHLKEVSFKREFTIVLQSVKNDHPAIHVLSFRLVREVISCNKVSKT